MIDQYQRELLERIAIYTDACRCILKYKDHPLIKEEYYYQKQRIKYSKAYFEGQPYYIGPRLVESSFFGSSLYRLLIFINTEQNQAD